MTQPVRDAAAMIAGMAPALDPQPYCFLTADGQSAALELMRSAIGTFREAEGLSLIVPADAAAPFAPDAPRFARIVLQVHSDLEGVGLTAAVASALADAGIACNMVAAFHHDHAFVPAADGERALNVLRALAQGVDPAA